ncbi:MAG: AAA family ATPase [Christensenellales bacterium]|jgi:cytidylate kinase
MSKPRGIIVFGANGSGKTTLGRELARILGYKHMDIEDYAFRESEIPYTDQRSKEECMALMLADFKKHRSFIISAVTGDFGDEIQQLYELAVFISAPVGIRIERIKQREYKRHAQRVLEGGDMYEQNLKFIDFVSSRSLASIERWAEILTCPVIRIDGTVDWRENAADIARYVCDR